MRIRITFRPREPLVLPIHYHPILQGVLYRNLDEALAAWYHDRGYPYHKRRFKLFTFSRLFARRRRFDPEHGEIHFSGTVHFHVGAVDTEFLESLASYLVRKGTLRVGDQVCDLAGIEVELPPPPARPIRIRTLSPISVYRTYLNPEGRRKTHFFHPTEDAFATRILENLQRKAVALWGEAPPLDGAWIRPVRVGKEVITYFKGTLIKGWDGEFDVSLPEPYYRLMLDAGLGAKNSQGFGMVSIVTAKKDSGGANVRT